MFNNAKLIIELIIVNNWILLDLELKGNYNRYLKNRVVVSSIYLYKKRQGCIFSILQKMIFDALGEKHKKANIKKAFFKSFLILFTQKFIFPD